MKSTFTRAWDGSEKKQIQQQRKQMEQKQRYEEREKWKRKEDGLQIKSITADWKWHEILRKDT